MVFWHVVGKVMKDHLIKKCKGFQIIFLCRPQFYLKAHDKTIHSDSSILLVLKKPFNVFCSTGQEDVPQCKIIYITSVAMTDKIEQKKPCLSILKECFSLLISYSVEREQHELYQRSQKVHRIIPKQIQLIKCSTLKQDILMLTF